MHSVSFESPYQFDLWIFLAKRIAALLMDVVASQNTPIFLIKWSRDMYSISELYISSDNNTQTRLIDGLHMHGALITVM